MMKVILTVLILARGIMPLELALLLSASSRLRELEPAEPKEEHNFILCVTPKVACRLQKRDSGLDQRVDTSTDNLSSR
jgi:hypothetical protein